MKMKINEFVNSVDSDDMARKFCRLPLLALLCQDIKQ